MLFFCRERGLESLLWVRGDLSVGVSVSKTTTRPFKISDSKANKQSKQKKIADERLNTYTRLHNMHTLFVGLGGDRISAESIELFAWSTSTHPEHSIADDSEQNFLFVRPVCLSARPSATTFRMQKRHHREIQELEQEDSDFFEPNTSMLHKVSEEQAICLHTNTVIDRDKISTSPESAANFMPLIRFTSLSSSRSARHVARRWLPTLHQHFNLDDRHPVQQTY